MKHCCVSSRPTSANWFADCPTRCEPRPKIPYWKLRSTQIMVSLIGELTPYLSARLMAGED